MDNVECFRINKHFLIKTQQFRILESIIKSLIAPGCQTTVFKGSRKLPWPWKHLSLPDAVRNQSDATEGKRRVHWDSGDCCS